MTFSMLRACDPPSLVTFLNSGVPFNRANLLTLTLASGVVVRLTDYDIDVNWPAQGVYSHAGPMFKRSMVTHRRGVEVDSLTLTLMPASTDLLNGVSWMTSIRAGVLDYAKVSLDIAIFDVQTPTVLEGVFNWFYGSVAEIPEWGVMGARVECKSDSSRLDILMPRNLIQAGCLHTLFDLGCGLSEAANRTTGTISSVAGDGSLVTGLGSATGTFDEGRLVITSGDNTGVARKIKRQVTTNLYLFAPFVFPIAPGTTFYVTPGCDKTKDTCNTKFSNVVNFRGFPYVPLPEAVL